MFHFDLSPIFSLLLASVVGFAVLVACTIVGVWVALPAWVPLVAVAASGLVTFALSQIWLSR